MSTTPPLGTSLDDLLGLLRSQNPALLDMILAADEGEFLLAAERALEQCIRTIESGAKKYRALDELGLSKLLTDLLTQAGFKAESEGYHNGHVDVTIRHFDPTKYRYLGECKIYGGFKYHRDGCEQVLGYCSGRDRRAFCLDFFKEGGIFTKLKKLRERFDSEQPLGLSGTTKDHFITGSFVTAHPHDAGCEVEILHVGCRVHVES